MKVTIKEVAKEAGVSIGTVDRALNGRGRISPETKQKVMDAVRKLDYHKNVYASAVRKCSKTKILIINAKNPNRYMNIFTKTFHEQAEEYAGFGLELEFVFAETLGANDMLRTVESIQVEAYDGILINASGPELEKFINKAQAANVPVATFNSDVPDSQRVFYSGENHFAAGRLCGELIAKFLRGRGHIAMFLGDETVFSLSERVRGFRIMLSGEYPDIEIIKVVSHGDDSALAEEKAGLLFETEKPIDAIFCNSATGGVPLCRYLRGKKAEERPMVIAYDEGVELVEMLREGICTAIIYQEPVLQARKALSYMFDALCNQKGWPEKKESQIMPSVVLRENCDVYFEHLQK